MVCGEECLSISPAYYFNLRDNKIFARQATAEKMSRNVNSSEFESGGARSNAPSAAAEALQEASAGFEGDQALMIRNTLPNKVEETCIEMVNTMLLFEESEELRFRMASRILLWATRKRFDSLVLLIVQKIPEVKNATDSYGNTAVHISSYLCHTDCMKILLMSGCNKEAQNNKGYTPMHMAVKGGQMTSLCWLCESGVNLNSTDNDQNTPLMLAIVWGYSKLAQILLRYGCNPNMQGQNGRTALHLAVLYENMEILKMLIEVKANVEVIDTHGRRALHYAGYVGSTTSTGILLHAGADPKAKDFTGKTPADMTTHPIILQLLNQHGR